jgi:ATP-dependent Lon protease
MGILAELLAEVEQVKGLRKELETERHDNDKWYRRYYHAHQFARIWKKLAKSQRKEHAYRICVIKDLRDLARHDRSFAENRQEALSTKLEQAHKLIDTLRKQCQDDYEDIQELREQRDLADRTVEREHNKAHHLAKEVSRLYTENYELREKIQCTG